MGMKPRVPRPESTNSDVSEGVEKERLIEECEEMLERLVRERLERDGSFGSFADYEKAMLEIAHEVVRRRLEKKLQSIADGLAGRIAIEHTDDWHGTREGRVFRYRRHCPGTATYHSLVGPLRVKRYTYRECGLGSTYVALELAAGVIERMTPALAHSVAIGYAFMPPRTCEQMMLASGLRPPSRSTFDRAARDLGAYAASCNGEIEPLVRANELIDACARSIVLGLDRTAVPMRGGERGTHDASMYDGGLRNSRPKPRKRAEIAGPVSWRMDYVGTVALLDGDGSLLSTRKYRLPGEADAEKIVERMMADVRHALVQRPQLTISIVQDGAPELWRVVVGALAEEPLVSSWTETLDWYHLDERLGKCMDLCTAPSERESQRKRWHAQLLESDTGVRRVVRSLRRQVRQLPAAAAEELTGHIAYIVRNQHRAVYASRRRDGAPIGSGITEGACKSLVGARAKRSGQRWSQRGLTAALHLRAIHDSGRFEGFWSFFSRRYRASHIVPLGPN
jgi:hypothetical protein